MRISIGYKGSFSFKTVITEYIIKKLLDTNYRFNNCIGSSIVHNIWMIKIDKVDLKFIFFTTAIRILELTRLFTARVIYEKHVEDPYFPS